MLGINSAEQKSMSLPPALESGCQVEFHSSTPFPHLPLPGDSLLKLSPSLSWGLPSAALPHPVFTNGKGKQEEMKQMRYQSKAAILRGEELSEERRWWLQGMERWACGGTEQGASRLPRPTRESFSQCFLFALFRRKIRLRDSIIIYCKRKKCSSKSMDSRII